MKFAAIIPVENLGCMDPVVAQFDPGVSAAQEFGLHLLPKSEPADNWNAVSHRGGQFTGNASAAIKDMLVAANCGGNFVANLDDDFTFQDALNALDLQVYNPGDE